MTEPSASERLDKWLWAARLFKTRSQAAQACRSGHVKVSGSHVKPSRPVRPGETITVRQDVVSRTLKVVGLSERRVGPKLVPDLLEDLTPPEEYEKRKLNAAQIVLRRERGAGRPTKRERREIDLLLGGDFRDPDL